MRESAWQSQVVALAGLCHWSAFHPHDMRRSEPGWPDLTLVRYRNPGSQHPAWAELIFAELKTEKGKLSDAQLEWGRMLTAVAEVAENVDYFVWRPSDFDAVRERLR